MARCPECNARLNTPSDLELWDHLFCEACGVELEVLNTLKGGR
jgi:lysine biosynthesis protein LysW